MTNDELTALRLEAERLWVIQCAEEEKYKAHVHAWSEAAERVRQAERELEVDRLVAQRLAEREAA